MAQYITTKQQQQVTKLSLTQNAVLQLPYIQNDLSYTNLHKFLNKLTYECSANAYLIPGSVLLLLAWHQVCTSYSQHSVVDITQSRVIPDKNTGRTTLCMIKKIRKLNSWSSASDRINRWSDSRPNTNCTFSTAREATVTIKKSHPGKIKNIKIIKHKLQFKNHNWLCNTVTPNRNAIQTRLNKKTKTNLQLLTIKKLLQ